MTISEAYERFRAYNLRDMPDELRESFAKVYKTRDVLPSIMAGFAAASGMLDRCETDDDLLAAALGYFELAQGRCRAGDDETMDEGIRLAFDLMAPDPWLGGFYQEHQTN